MADAAPAVTTSVVNTETECECFSLNQNSVRYKYSENGHCDP